MCRKVNIKHYALLLAGAAILSFGLFNVHSQSGTTEGGVLGMTLLLNHWFHISPSVTGIVMDFTCYFIGWRVLGNSFLKNAMFASCCFSLSYRIWESIGYILPSFADKPLVAAVLGAIFVGVGVGICLGAGVVGVFLSQSVVEVEDGVGLGAGVISKGGLHRREDARDSFPIQGAGGGQLRSRHGVNGGDVCDHAGLNPVHGGLHVAAGQAGRHVEQLGMGE